jgi:hypothetical protein
MEDNGLLSLSLESKSMMVLPFFVAPLQGAE